ncbi:MAG: hypothetical protein AAF211_20415, partial [Myxococcota bacterium]
MILGLVSSLALGGGWTRDQGAAYVKVGSDVYQALRFRLPGEAEDSVGDYFAHQHGLYAEVGLSRGHPVQLTVSAPGVVGTHRTQIFDAFGPERMFWGTDISKMPCSWQRCVAMFT